jgi:DEAD/DEAH box helicase domain-containing protein
MSTKEVVQEYISALKTSQRVGKYVVHHEELPPHSAQYGTVTRPWAAPLTDLLERMSLSNLYTHQVEAIETIRSGRHTVVATPTASGKTLIYNLPVLESILNDPQSKSLYLFPLKALAQDQDRAFQELLHPIDLQSDIRSAIYDGDTPLRNRLALRLHPPHILMTNPEMLHLGILPYHSKWSHVLANLSFVIVDEVHTYRGIMGSNMAWVFRRLLRICRYYGAQPTFIFSSATVGNPKQLTHDLTGLDPHLVSHSGAAQGKRHCIFINPLEGAAQTALLLLEAALPRGLRTIVYSQSRKMTELIALWASQRCTEYSKYISAYRSGFLPNERREIESKLANGQLLAVISTSALELGIDIGELDLCILVGYPGSVMATWQRAGRVGRKQQESVLILIGHEDSLDQYFMHNPQKFFQLPPENAVVNPYNPVIMSRHLQCAAADLPLSKDEPLIQDERIQEVLSSLEREGSLISSQDQNQLFAVGSGVQREIQLRGTGQNFQIINQRTNQIIGSIDRYRSYRETHPGAVYLHRSETYLVESVQEEHKAIMITPAQVNYFTRVRINKETQILRCLHERSLGQARIGYGHLQVTERVNGYEQRRVRGQELIRVVSLDMSPLVFVTEGIWIALPSRLMEAIEEQFLHCMGGIHALEHACIGILPLLVLTDRNDLGGISDPMHCQLSQAAVFIYESVPGGVGLAQQAFNRIEELIERTYEAIASCPCELGCPSCVQSPKCGSGNRPLDKQAALMLLRALSPIKGQQTHQDRPHPKTHQRQTRCFTGFLPRIENARTKRPHSSKTRPRYGVLDIETQRSAQEVGGWHKASAMGVSCAVLYEAANDSFVRFLEDDVPELLSHLQQLELVIGFNIKGFDYHVLQAYSHYSLDGLPTLDLLERVFRRLGYRISLDNLAQATLGIKKNGQGLQAIEWWKQGEIEKLVHYCEQDVRITHNLYLFGQEYGYLMFENKARSKVKIIVDWE